MDNIDKFLDIFERLPSLSILYIYKDDNLSKYLQKLIDNDGRFIKIEFKKEIYKSFKSKTRDFEYIVLDNVISSCKNKNIFLKMMYSYLENSSFIMIIEDNIDIKDEIISLLDKSNFLVPNNIELFENKLFIMAKKMHMWDGGL